MKAKGQSDRLRIYCKLERLRPDREPVVFQIFLKKIVAGHDITRGGKSQNLTVNEKRVSSSSQKI